MAGWPRFVLGPLMDIDEIVGWLREEASKRGLPFVDMAGRMLVKRAIRNARKADGHRAS